VVFDELSALAFGGVGGSDLNEAASLPARTPYEAPAPAPAASAPVQEDPADEHLLGELLLIRYRPLFSGPVVERVSELAFQRPPAELELSAADAAKRTIDTGDTIVVRSNGTSIELRARVNRRLLAGVARVADEHASDLHLMVEVVKA
jgi:anaerobic selenocysteine-containing dehydrogenase